MHLKEIGLHGQNMTTALDTIVIIIMGGTYTTIERTQEFSILLIHKIFVWAPKFTRKVGKALIRWPSRISRMFLYPRESGLVQKVTIYNPSTLPRVWYQLDLKNEGDV